LAESDPNRFCLRGGTIAEKRDEVLEKDSVPMFNSLSQSEIDQQVQVLSSLAVGLELYFPKPVCNQVT